MIRRNLSGIYIFDKFPEDEKRQPTCIEDCQEETRLEWLSSLELEALYNTAKILEECMSKLWTFLKPEEQAVVSRGTNEIPLCSKVQDKEEQVKEINYYCIFFRGIADLTNICTKE